MLIPQNAVSNLCYKKRISIYIYGSESDFVLCSPNKDILGIRAIYIIKFIEPSCTIVYTLTHTRLNFRIFLMCVSNIHTSYEEMVVSKMKLAGGLKEKRREKGREGILLRE